MPKKITSFILHATVVFVPASLILYFALHSGALPDNDYWGEMAQIVTEQGKFSSNFHDWFKRSNEHYTLLPKLVYAANLVISGGNNVGLSLFSWFMALLQVLVLYRLIPVRNKQHPILFVALLSVVAVLTFSPRQAHNWILGMSGVAWISANFFSIAAFATLQRYSVLANKTYLWLTLLLSLCAVATYSTSLALFPTLVIAAFLYPLNRQDKLLLGVYSLVILGLYYSTYSVPSNHPAIQHSVLALVTYILVFIGGLFTLQIKYALISGIFGLLSSALMMLYIYRKEKFWSICIPWICIQLYVCGGAAMAALARSGFGMEQALSSRYGALPALFWLAWIMLASTVCLQQQFTYRKISIFIFFCISSSIIFNTYRVGLHVAEPLLERAQRKSLALASIYSQAYDIKLIHAVGIPTVSYARMEQATKILIAAEHIPFNGLYKNCPEIGSKLTHIQPADTKQFLGAAEEIKLLKHKVIKVKGWAYDNGADPACIVLTNQNNKVRGIASYGLERLDIAQTIPGVLSSYTGWQGYGKVYKHDKIIKVYMLTTQKYWVALNGRFQIHHQPLEFQKI